MSDFEKDLSNVMGSFISTELDYIEKSHNELEEVTKERDLYKSVLEEVREHCECMIKIYGQLTKKQQQEELSKFLPYDKILKILDKVKGSE